MLREDAQYDESYSEWHGFTSALSRATRTAFRGSFKAGKERVGVRGRGPRFLKRQRILW